MLKIRQTKNLHLQTTIAGSILSLEAAALGLSAAADFFKVLTISLIKLIKGLLLVANALVSNCKNASMRNGSLRSIRFLMLSKTVFMLINVAGEGGDCDLEVGLDDPPVPRYIAADAGLDKKIIINECTGQDQMDFFAYP